MDFQVFSSGAQADARAHDGGSLVDGEAQQDERTQEDGGTTSARTANKPRKCHAFDWDLRESTVKAELLWCLNLIKQNHSFNSCSNFHQAF